MSRTILPGLICYLAIVTCVARFTVAQPEEARGQQIAQSPAPRDQALANLKQIGAAMLEQADRMGRLPEQEAPDKNGKRSRLSWRVQITSSLDPALFQTFHRDEPWDSEWNKKMIERMPAVFKDPRIRTPPGMTVFQGVVGRGMAFEKNKEVRMADIVDGPDKTICVVEVDADKAVPWTKPDDWHVDIKDPLKGLADVQPAGDFLALYLDGHAEAINRQIKLEELRTKFTLSAGDNGPVTRKNELPNSKLHAAVLSGNHLGAIGMAMANEYSAHKQFTPRAVFDKDGKPILSWRVQLLPYLDADATYNEFHLDEPWNSEHNRMLIEKMPDVFTDPKIKLDPGMTVYQAVMGPGMGFEEKKPLKAKDIPDGQANTIIVVEVASENAVPWTKPADWEIDGNNPFKGLAEAQPGGGFQVLFWDGHVDTITRTAAPESLRAFFTRNGGENIDANTILHP